MPEEMEKQPVLLKDGERIDDLQRNGYMIIQNKNKFCFGMDAVLLSGFATAKKGDKVLDLGTGTGIIPILMEAKTEADHFCALEIQPESADMAIRSVKMNKLESKIEIIVGDIKNASTIFGKSKFDVVTSNPPYMPDEHGIKNENDAKTIARHEVLCNLEDVVREAAAVLREGGHFYMVHRPLRLVEIFETLRKYRLEPKTMRFVYPSVDKCPSMVLIESILGAKPELKVGTPLIIYGPDGKYTSEISEKYGF